jgi:hypothetical protein
VKPYALWGKEGVSGVFTREQCRYREPGARPPVAAGGRGLLMADGGRDGGRPTPSPVSLQ